MAFLILGHIWRTGYRSGDSPSLSKRGEPATEQDVIGAFDSERGPPANSLSDKLVLCRDLIQNRRANLIEPFVSSSSREHEPFFSFS